MRLSDLLSALPDELRPAPGGPERDDPVIRGVAYDSRRVAPGDLFFALRGADTDGHRYLGEALERGAAAVVVEEIPPALASALGPGGRPAIAVPDARRALAPVATRFYGDPAAELDLVGVTGTNGKTSVTYLVESILARAGRRVGLIGTVEQRFAGVRERAHNTTPESLDLQRTLRAMRTRGADGVVMEVSSHGLELGRVDGCRFRVAAFTNLSQDHLDFHPTMEAYLRSKLRLFERHLRPDDAAAVVNVDDPAGATVLEAARAAGARIVRITRERDGEAELRLLRAEVRLDGTTARVALPAGALDLALPLVGEFNVENALVACGIAVSLGVAEDAIAAGIAGCPQVPGRVERVGAEIAGAPTVLVDYAHTPDAVEKVLRSLAPLTRGHLVTVFGCGGDRDRGKRPLMAEAVAQYSDRVVATSDNPRSEDPRRILADVESGLAKLRRVEPGELGSSLSCYTTLVDRREAIALAIGVAGPDDTVVIAGKGHEDYQILGRERVPMSDVEEARKALRGRAR